MVQEIIEMQSSNLSMYITVMGYIVLMLLAAAIKKFIKTRKNEY